MPDYRSPDRRDFLTGRAAADAAADAIEQAAAKVAQLADRLEPFAVDDAPPSGTGYVLSFKRRAMACDFEIRLNAGGADEQAPAAAAIAALDLIEQIETQLTVYRETSEVIDLNRKAADGPVRVDSQLFGLLQLADQLYHQTHGAFDLTAGPLSRAWGFDRRAGRMPGAEQIEAARELVGWNQVELNAERQEVQFHRAGVEINLNSIGKGYALDRAGELLVDCGVGDFLFHGGRSTLLARGQRTGSDGWLARLRHPLRPQQAIAQFRLRDEALSTSGSATQSFVHRGRRYGHLIDPRTGWPADGVHSATVIAPSAALADALSTAMYVMGPERAAEYCAAHREVRAVMVLPTPHQGEVEVRSFNFESGDEPPAD